jgi:aminopeptidase-like protein
MKSKYGMYDEYHTSLDNLDFISAKGLYESYNIYIKMIEALEINKVYKVNNLCEPQLGKRGLYPETSTLETNDLVKNMMDFLAYCDGKSDLLSIAQRIGIPIWELEQIVTSLNEKNVISLT